MVHPNATIALREAFRNGDESYESNGAVSFYYEEARNFYSTNQYVVYYTTIMLETAFSLASSTFTSRIIQTASSGANFNFTAFSTSIPSSTSSLLTQPFSYSTFNLHPFDQLAGTASTTAGQIYLIIFTFFIGL